jgi:hypothetical protein
MNLPGSTHVALGKRLFEKYPLHEFEPHHEWATYDGETPNSYGPYATGIPGKVRIVYVPEPRSINARQLEQGAKYRASGFDPQTGETTDLGRVTADADLRRTASAPSAFAAADDWVLVLERID